MTHPKHPPAAEQGASTGSRAEAAREREISAEQEVVDRAYRELDRRLESALISLSPFCGTFTFFLLFIENLFPRFRLFPVSQAYHRIISFF